MTDFILRIHAYVRLLLSVIKVAWYRFLDKEVVYIAGIPSHVNIGDRAIGLAECDFVRKWVPNKGIVKLHMSTLTYTGRIMPRRIVKGNDIFALHGGGNLGNVYMEEVIFRMFVIENYTDNKVIIFPQTMNFQDNQTGRKELKKHELVFGSHKNLTLFAREKTSYGLMKKHFPNNTVHLVPDIVLSYHPPKKVLVNRYILMILRNDIEKNLDEQVSNNIQANVKRASRELPIIYSDMIYQRSRLMSSIVPDRVVVNKKMREISRAKYVVTDRLHGMVFSAIQGIPVIAMSNYDWKISGVYDWLKSNPYITYVDDPSNFSDDFKQFISRHDDSRQEAYSPDQFDEHWKIIAKSIDSSK